MDHIIAIETINHNPYIPTKPSYSSLMSERAKLDLELSIYFFVSLNKRVLVSQPWPLDPKSSVYSMRAAKYPISRK